MRPAWPRIIIPVPVAIWIALGAGHVASAAAPVPALLERGARSFALGLGALSLSLFALARRSPGSEVGRTGWRRTADRAEPLAGILALAAAGIALGAEADRAARPLPVHPEEVAVIVEGKVLDTTAIDADPGAVLLEARRLRVGEMESSCRANLLLRWRDDAIPPRWILPGLWLRLGGRFRPPEDARNPGGSAPGRWLERIGVDGVVAVDPLSVTAPPDPPERGASFGAAPRDRIARSLAASLSAPVAALARGMLLGDRSGIDPVVQRSFRAGGTIHILSISGLHVCIVAGFLSLLASALRLPLAPAIALELAALWGYVSLVGAPASAVRSAILWTSLRSGRALGQVVRPFTAWGLAGLTLHLLDPSSVSDPGFQLSFLAVLGLGASGPLSNLAGRRPGSRGAWRPRIRKWGTVVWSLFVQSAAATAGTTGLQSRLFGAIPVVGLLLNLAVIPLCTLFMAEAILFLAIASFGIPSLAGAASGAVDASGLLLLGLNARGAELLPPWIIRQLAAPAALIGIAVALLAAWGRAEAARCGQATRPSAARWSIATLLLAAAVPLAGSPPSSAGAVILSLDVGQGDATWIGLPGGGSILTDAGPADDRHDAGEREIEPALRAEGRGRIPLAILSHAHVDHYGGFAWLARRGWIAQIVENGSDPSGAWRRAIRGPLAREGGRMLAVARDTSWVAPLGAALTILRGLERGAENDRSISGLIHAGGASLLFSGDLETAGEGAVLPRLTPIDVLKAPHHGSKTSSGSEWVDRLRPRVVLISCGEGNRFGHPDSGVLDRYRRAGATVWRTDQEGAIRVTLGPRGAWISTRRHPAPVLVTWDRDGTVTPSTHIP